jgi:hypothetical protein
MLRRMAMPDYVEWDRQIRATGGCSNPIRIRGGRVVTDAKTGEVLDAFHTDASPAGYLLIPCGNRRAEVCPSCSEVYRYDAYQLVRAGLAGGKGVPESVAMHPSLFVTLTAPSFGAVHNRHIETGRDGLPLRCRPRRDADVCPHGIADACFKRHDGGDLEVGHSLCVDCYDYHGAVLFNIHAGVLWRRLSIYLRREIAKAAGLPRSRLDAVARLSFVKVAEYQSRGVVHFHAVLRLDGPDGPKSTPPDWASVVMLDSALRAALSSVFLEVPDPATNGEQARTIRFGKQVDTQVIHATEEDRADGLTSRAVARYIAKYATKAAETTGTVARRIRRERDIDRLGLAEHVIRMIRACFEVAGTPGLEYVDPFRTAHMLGYGGHCTTKSRHYSTTFGRLRDDRREHRASERRTRLGLPSLDGRAVDVAAEWIYLRSGLSYGEKPLVAAIVKGRETCNTGE